MPYTCPVCGFNGLDEPPYSPDGHGLFEICPSCGFQFGVTDDDLGISFREWRESWVAAGEADRTAAITHYTNGLANGRFTPGN